MRNFIEDRWHVRGPNGKTRSARYGVGKQWRAAITTPPAANTRNTSS